MSVELIEQEINDFIIETNKTDIKSKLNKVISIANGLEVINEDSFNHMTSFYSEAKDWEKRIEFFRKETNAPDQDRINARNDKAKELLTLLKQIQGIAKSKCDQYQTLLEKQREEEQKSL